MFQWLHEHAASLPAPLGVCELLLSPSVLEPDAAGVAQRATMENFELAANTWREAARSHRDNIALFYFAGHGLIRNTTEKAQVLLLEEFGSKPHKILSSGVEMANVVNGMASLSELDPMARMQLYFIDACRSFPDTLTAYQEQQGSTIWDIPAVDPKVPYKDDRLAPVIYTAEPGATAFGVEGTGSVFGEALLASLDGGAGRYDEASQQWTVSLASLTQALPEQLAITNRKYDTQQMVRFSDIGPDALLRTLDQAPLVEVTITVEPVVSRPLTGVSVANADDVSVIEVAAPFPEMHRDHIAAGNYRVTAQGVKKYLTAQPPATPWRLQVQADG
ncbi:MAG: caspase family protein [Caldimonas sp.]